MDYSRIRQRAQELGIADSQKEYYWIAEQSLSAQLPEGWIEKPDGYYNIITEHSQQLHPSLDYYRQLFEILITDKETDEVVTPYLLPTSAPVEPKISNSPIVSHSEKIPMLHRTLENIETFCSSNGIKLHGSRPKSPQKDVGSVVEGLHNSIDSFLSHLTLNRLVSTSTSTWDSTIQSLTKMLEASVGESSTEDKLLSLASVVEPFLGTINFNTWQDLLANILGPDSEHLTSFGANVVPILASRFIPNEIDDESTSIKSHLETVIAQLEKKMALIHSELAKSKQLHASGLKREEVLNSQLTAAREKLKNQTSALEAAVAENAKLAIQLKEAARRPDSSHSPETEGTDAIRAIQAELAATKDKLSDALQHIESLRAISTANSSMELLQSLEMASKKINRKKELILGLRERNNDLKKANTLLAQELQHSVAVSQGFGNECDMLRQMKQPPPYRVIEKTITNISHSLEAKAGRVEDLEIMLAMVTADRDELAKINKDSQSYLTLLESQLQELKHDNRNKADSNQSLIDKIRNYERVQEAFVKKILVLRADCDRLCLRINDFEGNRRVICRIRTPSSAAVREYSINTSRMLSDSRQQEYLEFRDGCRYCFDKVFPSNSSQEIVFEEVEPSIRRMMRGGRLCIFSYGAASSGKTFTLQGSLNNPGLVERTFHAIFAIAEMEASGFQTSVSMSIVHIHNERLHDALSDDRVGNASNSDESSEMQIRSVGNGGVYVEGLSGWPVASVAEALQLVSKSKQQLKSLDSEDKSFRSHVVVSIEIKRFDLHAASTTRGYLQLVDLAASNHHRASAYDAQSQWRFKEGQYINRSLGALADVLRNIRDPTALVQPRFRSSKLTHLLQDYLNIHSKIIMIVNVDLASDGVEETVESLQFGHHCLLQHADADVDGEE